MSLSPFSFVRVLIFLVIIGGAFGVVFSADALVCDWEDCTDTWVNGYWTQVWVSGYWDTERIDYWVEEEVCEDVTINPSGYYENQCEDVWIDPSGYYDTCWRDGFWGRCVDEYAHQETVCTDVWVDGQWDTCWRDHYWGTCWQSAYTDTQCEDVLISQCEDVWIPGYWENQCENVWIDDGYWTTEWGWCWEPGHWDTTYVCDWEERGCYLWICFYDWVCTEQETWIVGYYYSCLKDVWVDDGYYESQCEDVWIPGWQQRQCTDVLETQCEDVEVPGHTYDCLRGGYYYDCWQPASTDTQCEDVWVDDTFYDCWQEGYDYTCWVDPDAYLETQCEDVWIDPLSYLETQCETVLSPAFYYEDVWVDGYWQDVWVGGYWSTQCTDQSETCSPTTINCPNGSQASCTPTYCEAEGCGTCTPECPVNSPPVTSISCDASECNSTGCVAYTGCPFYLINNSTDPEGTSDITKSEWDILNWGGDPDLSCTPGTLCDFTPQTQTLGPGSFTAELYIEDTFGVSDAKTQTFQIKQEARADFKCSLDNELWQDCDTFRPAVKEKAYFLDQSSSSEGSSGIISREWSFQGGSPDKDSGNDLNPSTRFQSGGLKSVSLTITDDQGRDDTKGYNISPEFPLPEYKEVAPTE